jgi:hypothetical protein
MIADCPHCGAFAELTVGVKLYVVVDRAPEIPTVEIVAGDQVPAIVLLEVVGSKSGTAP